MHLSMHVHIISNAVCARARSWRVYACVCACARMGACDLCNNTPRNTILTRARQHDWLLGTGSEATYIVTVSKGAMKKIIGDVPIETVSVFAFSSAFDCPQTVLCCTRSGGGGSGGGGSHVYALCVHACMETGWCGDGTANGRNFGDGSH